MHPTSLPAPSARAAGCACSSSSSARSSPPSSRPIGRRPAPRASFLPQTLPRRHCVSRTHRLTAAAGEVQASAAPSADAAAAARLADTAPTLDPATAAAIAELRAAASAVPDRGVYGTKAPAKERILAAVSVAEALVSAGPPPASTAGGLPPSPLYAADGAWAPTAALPAMAGTWAVLWSTVTCTGSRRVKLGLKTAVALGGVAQTIDADARTATNTVSFTMLFAGGAAGALTLEAAYEPLSPTRVGISLTRAALAPPALDALFGPARLPLLLEIFNPEGWLETTFVGGGLRIGRDNKGNVFVLERVAGGGDRPAAA